MAVKAIPDGYTAITPYLMVEGASTAIEFYRRAFDAQEIMRLDAPGGRVGHAELRIGNAVIMLADNAPEALCKDPHGYGGTPVTFLVYVQDVDAQWKTALAAGAVELRPIKDQFYGDRSGTLRDPFGHIWTLATHIEDVSEEEMNRRIAAMHPQG
ncbi:MAG: VOC family protein [Candidatus Eisenbacteria bacterium]